jgi:hypothetical protein
VDRAMKYLYVCQWVQAVLQISLATGTVSQPKQLRSVIVAYYHDIEEWFVRGVDVTGVTRKRPLTIKKMSLSIVLET